MTILKNQKHEVTYNTETEQVIYNERNFNTTKVPSRLFVDEGTSPIGPGPEPSYTDLSHFTYDIYTGDDGEGLRLLRYDDYEEDVNIAPTYNVDETEYAVKYLYEGIAPQYPGDSNSKPGCFQELPNTKNVILPNTIKKLENIKSGYQLSGTFLKCYGLINIEIPSSIISIGDGSFRDCISLTSIKIPSSVTSIGDSAFYECSSLTSIEIPESVTSIGNSVFSGCSNLTNVEIPLNLTIINEGLFYYCTSLVSIKIPLNITNIKNYAFAGCTSLTNISYLGTMSQWSGITLDTNWNKAVPATVVHCTDGDVTL